MKKLTIISAIALSGLLYNSADAQIRIHLGLNFSPRPVVYAPAREVVAQPAYYEPANYDGDEDYYYLPDVDAYYSVPEQCYYYNNGGTWVSAAYLPGAYRDYDWRSVRRYEVRAPRPFMHNDYYRARYNGVAFNGNWNRGYVNNNHYNTNQYRRNEAHYGDMNRGGNSRQFNQNRNQHVDQARNFNRPSAQEHFAQYNPQRNDRNGRDNHRPGRF